MRIILTGATGFIGSNLLNYLKDDEIKILNRKDLSNIELQSISGWDAIVHMAGKAHDLKQKSEIAEYYDINFGLTKEIYDVFLASDVKKFIFISSVKAVADHVENILTEESKANPRTDYGRSKLMAENYIRSRLLPSRKSYFILRPCMVYGPGSRGNLNMLYNFLKKGFPYPLGGFDNKRSFLNVYNLCFVIKELLYEDINSGIYQVSDDEPLSTKEIVNILSASINHKPKFLNISPNLIRAVAKVGDILHLPLTTERLEKLTENYIIDSTKIKKAIKKPLPYNSYQGLALCFKSTI